MPTPTTIKTNAIQDFTHRAKPYASASLIEVLCGPLNLHIIWETANPFFGVAYSAAYEKAQH